MSAKVVMMVFPYRGIEGMGLDDLELAEPVVWDRHIDFGAMSHQTLACRKIECGVGFRAFGYHEGFPFNLAKLPISIGFAYGQALFPRLAASSYRNLALSARSGFWCVFSVTTRRICGFAGSKSNLG